MSLSSFIWSVADLLRGDYKQSEYGKVILPFTVLRRMDCVLEETKKAVLAEFDARRNTGVNPEPFLLRKAKQSFYNTSPMDMKTLMGDQDHIKENLYSYIQAFSLSVRDIFERFDFYAQIDRLAKCGLLSQVTEKFAGFNLHPEAISNTETGTVFEELIRKFAEISNETAGEHFTPREVIRLMVNLIFVEDDDVLSKPGVVNAHTGKWGFIPEHADWAKREGNLQSLGMPTSVWESIRDIPNDYGGESRKSILVAVTAAGGVRMRGHRDVVVFEFTVDTKVICLEKSLASNG